MLLDTFILYLDTRSQDMVRIIDLQEDTPIDSEVQHFRQPALWALIGFVAFLSWRGATEQPVFGRPFGSSPAPDWMTLIIVAVFGIIFPLFFPSSISQSG